MTQYISKDALVAEIERTLHKTVNNTDRIPYYGGRAGAFTAILSFINTLEVKEVDLDKMLTEFMSRYAYENGGEYPSSIDIARRFFELGLNAQKGE